MSYCRFGKTNLVYMYGTEDEQGNPVIECCACRLTPQRGFTVFSDKKVMWWGVRQFKTRSRAMRHLADHAEVGHLTEWDAYDYLEAEKTFWGDSLERDPWDDIDETDS